MSTTRIRRRIDAPRTAVYQALVDATAVKAWMVPDGMTSQVHSFDAREGGSFRISLTYDEPTGTGKTNPHTDTYQGRFIELVEPDRVVEVMEFEASDPAMTGEMIVSFQLTESNGGTDVLAVRENVPPGVSPEANEVGWTMALEKLARRVEAS